MVTREIAAPSESEPRLLPSPKAIDQVRQEAPLAFSAKSKPVALAPFWNFCAGAGRAHEGLRAGWRDQLRNVVKHCGFRYLRFHGLFHDEMFPCRRENGKLIFNWQYIDDLFDGLLEAGIRPFVELGFFPADIAGESDFRLFWWKAHVTPPDDLGEWGVLVETLVRHLVQRYGLAEVRTWYFEVWNEPNLSFFFNGTRSQYFELYRVSALAVKRVDPSLKVGGPATSNFVPDDRFSGEKEDRRRGLTHRFADLAKAPWRGVWIEEFLEFCAHERLPLDFVSTHPYPTDYAFDAGGEISPRTRPVDAPRRDLEWVQRAVRASAYPTAEIHLTEFSSSPSLRDFTHDFPQAATFILKTNIEGSGLVHSLSYWTFTDICEEHGAGDTAFHGGFGLVTMQNIPKPAFHAYRFLAQLTAEEIHRAEGFLATRTAEGHLRAVAYHYPAEHPDAPPLAFAPEAAYATLAVGTPKHFRATVSDLPPLTPYWIEVVDGRHGFSFRAWQQMGSPHSPTRFQIEKLREWSWTTHRTIVSTSEAGTLELDLKLEPWAICLIRELK